MFILKKIVHFGVGGARPRFWKERGLELEAWRLWMTGCPLDTSGQKWTEPGMSPIVREAIVATAATIASRQLPSSVGVTSLKLANLWIENIVWVCARQFVPIQN